ncbi:transporter [Aquabacterium sp. J223]|uniref:transporter n=1 Tax=Aquabacterium sp. J223 TaxID=2898431 RepID=UPI00289CFDB4|nr:transporter [Aquabacterium sp. J223]
MAQSSPWLRRHAGLPEGFFEALGGGSRSTRIERERDELLAVVNDVTFDFAFEPSDVATLWVAVGERRVVTARRQALRSVDRLRAAANRGEAIGSPLALLDHLLRDQADELQRLVRQATERVDDIEDKVLAGRTGDDSADLARLRRLMVRLQRLLAPEPGALLRLLGNPPRWVPAEDLQRLRDASEDFALALRDVAALQERVKLLQEEADSRVAMENNRILFLLTTVTVLALPINLVAGLMGMNVGGIPLAEHAHGFAWVVALVLGVTGGAAWLVLKRLGRKRR